ncbi:hypothetical protein TBLA_0C01980 [Henningerozyma blattae CBS 6284]|uniref:Uncharacterized protein n=1 Tax=Henningerozyma blattae (strain ATCC 34711 / CBS 6284 / DSM 70876 / NBRC 10599 / NRRL Y-10934 / UCD 77-7) TaxID=1071380 RepID=I2H0V9_HENB6|nr:hypothetical protein TBLA_0C01980 [Tetrapisispora blattae CBS 6284]CCH60011.1 hypothetical protein TBLA_0C01980 [Tetrapisispora blattae CBS 6284]
MIYQQRHYSNNNSHYNNNYNSQYSPALRHSSLNTTGQNTIPSATAAVSSFNNQNSGYSSVYYNSNNNNNNTRSNSHNYNNNNSGYYNKNNYNNVFHPNTIPITSASPISTSSSNPYSMSLNSSSDTSSNPNSTSNSPVFSKFLRNEQFPIDNQINSEDLLCSSNTCNNNNGMTSIRDKNDLSRSFEDDLFYCPRSLLNNQELAKCQKIDYLFAANSNSSSSLHIHSSGSPPTNKFVNTSSSTCNNKNKYNPYLSQSFNPNKF